MSLRPRHADRDKALAPAPPDPRLSGRRSARNSPKAKSSLTSSRKSLNLSTTSSVSSTSCSNSIADSSMTSSAAKIGAATRTARASGVDGARVDLGAPFCRPRPSSRRRRCCRAGRSPRPARTSRRGSRARRRAGRGHRPRRRGALQLHQDRRGLGVTDPDRQEPVAVDGLQEDDRLLADHVEARRRSASAARGCSATWLRQKCRGRVGDPGFEPGTSSLSETRSNQLS